MTYTFKLAHRLGVLRSSTVLGLLALVNACGSDNLSPNSGSEPPAEASAADAVVLAPRTVTAETDQPIKFAGFARTAAGDSLASSLQYTATGGIIGADGIFSASTEGTYRVVAKGTGNTKPDTATVTILTARKGLSAIVVSPDTAKVATGGKQTFTATGKLRSGGTTAVGVNWTATGGTIDAGGTYTAGKAAGTYKVIATGASNSTLADTARVIVIAANPTAVLQAVVVTPSTASLQAGRTQQFVANGRMSDGTSSAVTVSWTATGGTITSGGLYTAGSSAGPFRVIATQVGGVKADTAALTITAPQSASCSGVTVAPNASIQTAVNNNPAGTAFCLGAGTFAKQTVIPKQGNSFIGARDGSGARLTTLDGGLATNYAFRNCSGCGGRDSVTIRGLKITRYMPPYQQGAVGADYPSSEATTGWVIADNEIYSNADGAGIRTGQKMRIVGNNIHHNGEIGIVGSGDSILVDGDTLAFNNTQGYSWGNEAGGTKFVKTRWLTVRNTFSHDNQGPGLWTDGSNIYVLYESNRIVNNAGAGIKHEISWDALIRNNTVSGNGLGSPPDWFWNAGIEISTSSNVQIYNNTVTNNARGIVGIAQVRGSDQYGTQQLANLQVHDNIVTMTNGWTDGVGHGNMTGIAADFATTVPFTTSLFARNTYYLGTGTSYFHWSPPSQLTVAQWRSYGQDLTGIFNQ